MEIGCFHFFNDITWISLSPTNDGKYTEFQDSFPHLALCVFNIHKSSFSYYYLGSLKQLMIITYDSCDLPFAIFLLPYMNKLKSAAILFAIFQMTKSMHSDLHSTIAGYRVNFKTSFYQ